MAQLNQLKGGLGSGNFGHAGRPGLIGGSMAIAEALFEETARMFGEYVHHPKPAQPTALDQRLVDYKPDRSLSDPAKVTPIVNLLQAHGHSVRYEPYSAMPFLDEMHHEMGVSNPNKIDIKEYLAKRNEFFNKLPIENVPLDSIVVTQQNVNTDRVQEIRDHPETAGGKIPFMVRFAGETYFINGHHRVVADVLDNKPFINGHVWDLGWDFGKQSNIRPGLKDLVTTLQGEGQNVFGITAGALQEPEPLRDFGAPDPHPITGRKFSSTQVEFPFDWATQIRQIGIELIPDEDLSIEEKFVEAGREMTPHITVKYGIHSDFPDDVESALIGVGPVTAVIGQTMIFEAPDYDVVNLDIISPGLHKLNKIVAGSTEVTDTHPTYKPHCCLAYVKKGRGQKYAGRDTPLTGQEIEFDKVTFCSRNGQETVIPLTEIVHEDKGSALSGNYGHAGRPGLVGGSVAVLAGHAITPRINTNFEKWKKTNGITEKKLITNAEKLIDAATPAERREGMQWYTEANGYAKELAQQYGTSVETESAIIAALSPQSQWPVNKEAAKAISEIMSRDKFTFTESDVADRIQSLEKSMEIGEVPESKRAELRATSQKFFSSHVGTHDTADLSSAVLARLISAPSLFTSKEKAIDIWRGVAPDKALGGFKVRSFYNDILNPKTSDSVTIDTHAIRGLMNNYDVSAGFKQSIFANPAQYNLMADTFRKVGADRGITPNQAQAIAWIVWKNKNP